MGQPSHTCQLLKCVRDLEGRWEYANSVGKAISRDLGGFLELTGRYTTNKVVFVHRGLGEIRIQDAAGGGGND